MSLSPLMIPGRIRNGNFATLQFFRCYVVHAGFPYTAKRSLRLSLTISWKFHCKAIPFGISNQTSALRSAKRHSALQKSRMGAELQRLVTTARAAAQMGAFLTGIRSIGQSRNANGAKSESMRMAQMTRTPCMNTKLALTRVLLGCFTAQHFERAPTYLACHTDSPCAQVEFLS